MIPIAALALSWPSVILALVLLGAGWLLGSYLSGVVGAQLGRSSLDPVIRDILQRLVLPGVGLVALATAVSVVGIDPGGVLVALATAGLLVVCGRRAGARDLGAGVQLWSKRPFNTGDHVAIGEVEGKVRDLGLFAATLEGDDGALITLWNHQIASGPVINHSRSGLGRLVVTVSLPRPDDLAALPAELVALAEATEGVRSEPVPAARLVSIDRERVGAEVVAWARTDVVADARNALVVALAGRDGARI